MCLRNAHKFTGGVFSVMCLPVGLTKGVGLLNVTPSMLPLLCLLLQDAATLSQVRTMLMPVRREAVQLQKRLTRQELEAAKQERLRQELAAEEARKEAARKLKASSWVSQRRCVYRTCAPSAMYMV
jgi:hypothetical protein